MGLFFVVCVMTAAVSCGEFNFALNKPTADSVNTPTSSNAVDGNMNTIHSKGSCYHGTAQTYPWWQVDLEVKVIVTTIKVTNRGDCCGDRIQDFSIDLYYENPALNQEAASKRCLFYEGQFPAGGMTLTLTCDQPVEGQFLRLRVNRTNWLLNFCELQVFGIHRSFSACSTLTLQKGQRLSSPSLQTLGPEFDSRAVCAAECNRRHFYCKGFNIKYQPTVTCELFDSSASSAADENWDAYLLNHCTEECE